MSAINMLELKIEKLANTGEGIGFYDNRTVFVPYSFPGELLNVAIDKIPEKGIINGEIADILQPHPKRIYTAKPFPGCDWLNLEYMEQLALKEGILIECLKYFGKFDTAGIPIRTITKADEPLNYRNNSTFTFSPHGLGVYQAGSAKLVPALKNPLLPEPIQKLVKELDIYFQKKQLPVYLPEKDQGDLRQLILKWNSKGEVLAGLITRNKELPKKEELTQELPRLNEKLTGLVQNINKIPRVNKLGLKSRLLFGRPDLTETINGLTYHISLTSFFQTNLEIAQKMQLQLKQWLRPDPAGLLFDLYGGSGFFGLFLAKAFGEVIVNEENPAAIEMGLLNQSVNGFNNIKFHQSPTEDFLQENRLFPSAVIIDPPRKGCSQQVLTALLTLAPKQVCYISCSPVTLARDLKTLTAEKQYFIQEITPFDMFPQTPHIETMVLLEKTSQ